MNNLKIKVCGISRLKDAKVAVKSGADLLGFIFFRKSPRYVSVKHAVDILNKIPATIGRVGVFVNEDIEIVLTIAKKCQLDYVQLSGDEKKRDIKIIQKNGFKVIKTIRIKDNKDMKKVKNISADIIHLDTADKKLYGGTGSQFDWEIKIPKSVNNLMLAGGINADNVLKGINLFHPLIIDVNSGVEFKPGLKSDKKIKQFFKTVNKYRYGR